MFFFISLIISVMCMVCMIGSVVHSANMMIGGSFIPSDVDMRKIEQIQSFVLQYADDCSAVSEIQMRAKEIIENPDNSERSRFMGGVAIEFTRQFSSCGKSSEGKSRYKSILPVYKKKN